jgi:hypothetical protein
MGALMERKREETICLLCLLFLKSTFGRVWFGVNEWLIAINAFWRPSHDPPTHTLCVLHSYSDWIFYVRDF